MIKFTYPNHPARHGYMSEKIQGEYITSAVSKEILPVDAHRIPDIISLNASNNKSKPIQFWQLYSVLGQDTIVNIIENFYGRVYENETWFTSVFAKVGDIGHHINTQASMWLNIMGGGPYYHGADFRLNFHHKHNAIQLMNEKGALRWSELMLETLDYSNKHISSDPRIRISINTFLNHFMAKYSEYFKFKNIGFFKNTNPPYKQKINFLKMSKEAIESLTEHELKQALIEQGVNVSNYTSKEKLINKAMMI